MKCLTCERFSNLVQDEPCWIVVEGRHAPNSWDKNKFIWSNANEKTKCILLAANNTMDVIMCVERLAVTKSFTSLTVLALEHQCIKYCKLHDFPNTLQELSLRWSFIPRHQEFFRFALHAMVRLKTLILDHCKWLEASSFMSFCRFPSLEILSVYMCKKLGDDDISSVSVAGRLGFKQLKVADLRFSGLGDLFLRTFHASSNLQIVYFQNFPSTYYLERWQRKLNILGGAQIIEHGYVSDDEDNNNLSKKVLQSRFNISEFETNNTQSITNSSISVLKRLSARTYIKERPSSVLYKYPYGECTCGFVNNRTVVPEPEIVDDELTKVEGPDFNEDPPLTKCTNPPNCWDKVCLEQKFWKEKVMQRKNKLRGCGSKNWYFLFPPAAITCGMIFNDSCAAPAWCQEEATPDRIVHNWMFKREPRNEFEIELLTYGEKNFRAANHLRCFNCECEPDIVVVHTNDDGNLEQVERAVNPNPVIMPNVREAEVGVIINKLVDFIRWIKRHNYNIDPERVLRGFTRCLDIGDLLAPAEDRSDFVAQIANLIIEFSKTKQELYYVLCYHAYCLKDVMTQLLTCSTVQDKKKILLHFFTNLVYTEKIGNDNSPQPSATYDPKRKLKDFVRTPAKRFKNCGFVPNTPMPLHKYVRNVTAVDDNTNLSELSFRGFYHINNLGLMALKDLNLGLLDVTGTNVTIEGVDCFIKDHPNCRVVHETACVCKPNLHF